MGESNRVQSLKFVPHNGFGQHSPEGVPFPFGYITDGATPYPIFELNVPLSHPPEMLQGIAVRSVAAFNATAGIPTEALEAGIIAELISAARRMQSALVDDGGDEPGLMVPADLADEPDAFIAAYAVLEIALAKIGGA